MVLGSKSGNVFPSGSIMVVVCSKVDKNRKVRDLANTSPMQLLFPRPNTNNLKLKKCSLHPQNVVQIYIIWINLDLLLLSSYFCIVFTFCYTVSLADFFFSLIDSVNKENVQPSAIYTHVIEYTLEFS